MYAHDADAHVQCCTLTKRSDSMRMDCLILHLWVVHPYYMSGMQQMRILNVIVCFIYDDSCSCCCSLGLKDMWGAVSTAWCDWGFSSRRCPNSGGRICFIIIGFHLLQRIPPSGRQRWDKAAWINRHIVVGLQTSHFVVLKFIPTKFKGFFL